MDISLLIEIKQIASSQAKTNSNDCHFAPVTTRNTTSSPISTTTSIGIINTTTRPIATTEGSSSATTYISTGDTPCSNLFRVLTIMSLFCYKSFRAVSTL
ncbi:unnamed protein product [Rotaria magnacalcarata]|uniref:Uncharacterized protein n=1 Tax=Rotaria magnacalcarata TaxID=392030 RepID=A0A8S3HUD9_9BILA|nr:unnamed protein product [Rotaria magnacalcarata]CAF5189215.1 unnamed protein product [Rotaria magnacalcarata]